MVAWSGPDGWLCCGRRPSARAGPAPDLGGSEPCLVPRHGRQSCGVLEWSLVVSTGLGTAFLVPGAAILQIKALLGTHTLAFGAATSARFVGAVAGGLSGGLAFRYTQRTAVAGVALALAGGSVLAIPLSPSLEAFAALNAVLGFAIYAGKAYLDMVVLHMYLPEESGAPLAFMHLGFAIALVLAPSLVALGSYLGSLYLPFSSAAALCAVGLVGLTFQSGSPCTQPPQECVFPRQKAAILTAVLILNATGLAIEFNSATYIPDYASRLGFGPTAAAAQAMVFSAGQTPGLAGIWFHPGQACGHRAPIVLPPPVPPGGHVGSPPDQPVFVSAALLAVGISVGPWFPVVVTTAHQVTPFTPVTMALLYTSGSVLDAGFNILFSAGIYHFGAVGFPVCLVGLSAMASALVILLVCGLPKARPVTSSRIPCTIHPASAGQTSGPYAIEPYWWQDWAQEWRSKRRGLLDRPKPH
eukprot:gene9760-1758_t